MDRHSLSTVSGADFGVTKDPEELAREQRAATRQIIIDQYHTVYGAGRSKPGTKVVAPEYDRIGICKHGTIVRGKQMVAFMIPLDDKYNNSYLRSVTSDAVVKFKNANFDNEEVIEAIVNSTGYLSGIFNDSVLTVWSGYDYESHTITLNHNGLVGFSETTDWRKVLMQAHGAIGKPKNFAIFKTFPNYLENDEQSN